MVLPYLIVQVPGLGGSVLARRGAPVWDLAAAKLVGLACQADLVAVADDDELEPIGLIDTMTMVPGLFALPGYDRMISNLRTWLGTGLKVVDYRPGVPIAADTDVLRVPYDFRRSIVDGAETLAKALSGTEAAQRGVVVLAHSMGGLVARYWAGLLDTEHRCRAVITLGAPHRGAPKALNVLVNGLGVGRLRHSAATRVLRGWPSMHELLPQYPAVWHADDALDPVDLPGKCVRAFGDSDAGQRFLRQARAAAGVHDEITTAWAQEMVPALSPFYARGHRTPNRATLTGERLRVSKKSPEWRGNPDWHGDGTVPMISAIPFELGERHEVWQPAVDKHGPLGGTSSVRALLTTMMGDRLPARGGAQPAKPWIGFDLDDVVWAGAEVPVGADVLGDVAGPGSAATVTVDGDVLPMVCRDDRWETVLPPLTAGVYEVVVEAKEADHGAAVFGITTLAVTEPAAGWDAGTDDEA